MRILSLQNSYLPLKMTGIHRLDNFAICMAKYIYQHGQNPVGRFVLYIFSILQRILWMPIVFYTVIRAMLLFERVREKINRE